MSLIFITGGSRSGKSSFALNLAEGKPGRKMFVATAQSLDEEMAQRIALHKRERGLQWETVEEPVNLTGIVRRYKENYDVILIDCLTIWLSNMLVNDSQHTRETLNMDIEMLLGALNDVKNLALTTKKTYTVCIVANEVGMGIVPDNPLARFFRDMAGRLNQKMAALADEVYFMVSGLPMKLK